jgi:hypothetical protein
VAVSLCANADVPDATIKNARTKHPQIIRFITDLLRELLKTGLS